MHQADEVAQPMFQFPEGGWPATSKNGPQATPRKEFAMFKQWLLASALVASTGMAHAFVNASIAFDGYCDGFSDLTTEGFTGAAGTWQNLDCAGSTATGGGAQVRDSGTGAIGYSLGTTGTAALTDGYEFTWVIRGDRTWSVYTTTGTYLNSGTWSPRPRNSVAPTGSRPSWQP